MDVLAVSIVTTVLIFGVGLLLWGLIWQKTADKLPSERTLRQLRKGLMMQGIMATEDEIEPEELVRLRLAMRRATAVMIIGLGAGVVIAVGIEVTFAVITHTSAFVFSPFETPLTWYLAGMLIIVVVVGVFLIVGWTGVRKPTTTELPRQYGAYRMRLLFWWHLFVFASWAFVSTLLLTGRVPLPVSYTFPDEKRVTPSLVQIVIVPVLIGLMLLIPEIVGRILIRRPPTMVGVSPNLAVRMQRRMLIGATWLLYLGTYMIGFTAIQMLPLLSDTLSGSFLNTLFLSLAFPLLIPNPRSVL